MTFRRSLLLGLLASAAPVYASAQQPAPVVPPPAAPQTAPAAASPSAAEAAPQGSGRAAQPVVRPVQPADEDEYADEDDAAGGGVGVEVEAVVVTAQRQRGAVLGDIPPDVQLNAQEIRALGTSSLTELLEALGPQVRSATGGPPVTLLNGRRISGFGEIRDLPPEAIERVDILPEEVALKYGYRADQRVVNFVTRRRFRAITAELGAGGSLAGGRYTGETDINVLRINQNGRTSFDVEYRRSTSLLESERDISPRSSSLFDLVGNIGPRSGAPGGEIDPALSALLGQPVTVAGVPASAAGTAPSLAAFVPTANTRNNSEVGQYRTLQPQSDQLSLNATVNRTVFTDVSATLNARLDLNASESLLGLPSATLTLPAASVFSPFASDVLLYRFAETPGALVRESAGGTGHFGLAMNGDISEWRWALTANYDLRRSETLTDAGLDPAALQARITADPLFNPFAAFPNDLLVARPRDRSETTNQTANAELVLNGRVIELPAGDVSATVRTGVEARMIDSQTFRRGVETEVDLSRERANAQVNIDVPLTSRRNEVLAAFGSLSANANLQVEQLSDFGTLTSIGGGLNWSPIEKLRLLASVTQEDRAPDIEQLGNPVILTPNARVFDFTRGESVDVTSVEGGNPALLSPSSRTLRLGLNLRPYQERDLSFQVNYSKTSIENPIQSFPAVTAQIEAAFPERFERDASGRLTRIDTRPVNFLGADREEIRSGLNYSRQLRRAGAQGQGGPGGQGGQGGQAGQVGGPARMGPPDAAQPGSPQAGGAPRAPQGGTPQAVPGQGGQGGGFPGAAGGQGGPGARGQGGFGGGGGGRGGFGGGGFGGGGGGNQGRLQLALYHTYRIADVIQIRDGLPELDLLGGAAFGSRGGRSRHEVEAQAGIFRSGFGARVEANWQSGTTVRADPTRPGTTGDLFFSDFSTVNLRLFADLGQQRALVRDHPFFRGSRVNLAVNNLFDARQEVQDTAGITPVNYQPDLIDPVGRSVRITFRKLFIPRRPPGQNRGPNSGPNPGGNAGQRPG